MAPFQAESKRKSRVLPLGAWGESSRNPNMGTEKKETDETEEEGDTEETTPIAEETIALETPEPDNSGPRNQIQPATT
jgi:hypothetical protein